MQQYPNYSNKRCSDSFIKEHIDGGRSDYCFCEACQRTICTDPETGSYDGGTYESLREKAKENPRAYIFLGHGINSISYGFINGFQVVFDCPCNFARVVENDLLEGIPHSAPPDMEKPWPQ